MLPIIVMAVIIAIISGTCLTTCQKTRSREELLGTETGPHAPGDVVASLAALIENGREDADSGFEPFGWVTKSTLRAAMKTAGVAEDWQLGKRGGGISCRKFYRRSIWGPRARAAQSLERRSSRISVQKLRSGRGSGRKLVPRDRRNQLPREHRHRWRQFSPKRNPRAPILG